MINQIIIKKEHLNKAPIKNNNKRKNLLFFTPPDVEYSSVLQSEKLKRQILIRKNKIKTSNITNSMTPKITTNTSPKYFKNENISLTCSNINSHLNYRIFKKNKNIDFTSISKIKSKYINQIKEKIDKVYKPKKNNILLNTQKYKITLKDINTNNFLSGKKSITKDSNIIKTLNTSFIYTKYKNKSNLYSKVYLYNESYNKISSSIKVDSYNISNINNKGKTSKNKNKRNKNISNKLNTDVDLSKKLIFNNGYIKSKINDKDKIKLVKNINKNNSSKLTNISSLLTSDKNEISKRVPKETNKYHYNKNKDFNINNSLLKKNIILNLTSEAKENETQDFESKFLNYELGVSDKVSTINYLDESIKMKKKVKKEYEKPIEEIEKIAKEIYNSELKNKKINNKIKMNIKNSYISKDIGINIEEFKLGEEIQNVFALSINKKNK